MLRARRKDISIKPNRRLDRKSSRGMIYENEELRLRTIHINAAIEQGQNDIKKLRKENEQLRREIWCLRDEYDKLEEILRKQKSHDGSDECESRSEDNEASQLSNSERGEEDINDDFFDDVDAENDDNETICNNIDNNIQCENDDDDDDDDDNNNDDDENDDNYNENNEDNEDYINVENREHKENKKETKRIDNDSLKNPDIQKFEKSKESEKINNKIQRITSEKINNNLDHLQVDFDGLSIVDEEEEQKKGRKYDDDLTDYNGINSTNSKQNLFSSSIFNTNPFIFPNVNHTSSQIFDSTSTPKLDTSLSEFSNSKLAKSPKPSVTFENHSPNKFYLDSSRFFAERNQNHVNLENQTRKMEIFNPNEIEKGTLSPLNVRPKQIFAPLKFNTSRKLFFAKQSAKSPNDFFSNHSLENEIITKQLSRNNQQSLINECQDNKSNDKIISNNVVINKTHEKIFNSEKRKSISLENLFPNKMQNETMNSFKLFSSCRNLNSEKKNVDFLINNGNFPNTNKNSQDNPSKSFKSQLSVILKTPTNILSKKNLQSPSTNCQSLNNLFYQNGKEITPIMNDNNDNEHYHGYQATSFEGPFPITLQIPSMMPIDVDYKNMPFLARKFYYPNEEMKFVYDSIPQKISAHTQTLDEDILQESNVVRGKKDLIRTKSESLSKDTNCSRKKSTKKEKIEKKSNVDRRKRDVLKNQVSISSCDESESPNAIITSSGTNFDSRENKHESRSSSSDVDSQRKEQTHRVSIYFNSKKRPSLTSMKSTRTMENSRNKIIPQKDHSDGNLGESIINSVNSKEIGNNKRRKTSTSSENVPWCACWGNGCI
ncbi:GATA zinc finger domain-containing protein 14-like isoform X2 [Leptopilina boulardi]|nr:GATA zinc finger domain-containing protein 14-like isoform X2 [Leptopilina boulardi]XP_051175139.1 GATA zinc finger domain-containing protein 14-like isoform X2 [Leptopilina boulardi]